MAVNAIPVCVNEKRYYFKNQAISIEKVLIVLCLNVFVPGLGFGQEPFARWTATELILTNGIVQRTIELPAATGNLLTTAYKPVKGQFDYFEKKSSDFGFEFNHKNYTGSDDWQLLHIEKITDSNAGNGAAITLLSGDKQVELTITYLLYPDLPVIRKRLSVKNITKETVSLESVDIEKFSVVQYYASTFSWIFSDYGRRRSLGGYEGNKQDALVMVHNPEWKQGIVIGNEAAGVMKCTSVFWEALEITSGLTHKNALFPVRKWIKPGGTFETPQVFTIVYNNKKDPQQVW